MDRGIRSSSYLDISILSGRIPKRMLTKIFTIGLGLELPRHLSVVGTLPNMFQ